jgi:hypothetical protein
MCLCMSMLVDDEDEEVSGLMDSADSLDPSSGSVAGRGGRRTPRALSPARGARSPRSLSPARSSSPVAKPGKCQVIIDCSLMQS